MLAYMELTLKIEQKRVFQATPIRQQTKLTLTSMKFIWQDFYCNTILIHIFKSKQKLNQADECEMIREIFFVNWRKNNFNVYRFDFDKKMDQFPDLNELSKIICTSLIKLWPLNTKKSFTSC